MRPNLPLLLLFAAALLLCGSGAAETAVPDGDAAASAVWQARTVDASGYLDTHTSLAFTPYGNPAIAYSNNTDPESFRRSIKYAWKDAYGWHNETVDAESAALSNPQLALDSYGNPRILYGYLIDGWSASYGFKYAVKGISGWKVRVVTVGQTGGRGSIRVDPAGKTAIAYGPFPGSNLTYATFSGAGWRPETADPAGGLYMPALQFDRGGNPAIAYLRFNGTSFFATELWYAFRNATGWHTEQVIPVPAGHSFAFVINQVQGSRPSICCHAYGSGSESIVYATRTAKGWKKAVVATGHFTDMVAIAISPAGVPSVAYQETADAGSSEIAAIKYAARTSSGWKNETVAVPGAGKLGSGVSLKFGNDGTPHVTFARTTNGEAYPPAYAVMYASPRAAFAPQAF